MAYVRSALASGTGTSVGVSFLTDVGAGNFVAVGATARQIISQVQELTDANLPLKACGTQDTFGPTTWGDIWYIENAIQVGGVFQVQVNGFGSVDMSIAMAEYTGVATASSLDKTHTGTNLSTAADTGATAATTQATELVFAMIGNESGSRTITWGGTIAEREDGGVCSTSIADLTTSATGTQQATGTVSGTNSVWVACIATFKIGGGGGAAPVVLSRKRGDMDVQQRMVS